MPIAPNPDHYGRRKGDIVKALVTETLRRFSQADRGNGGRPHEAKQAQHSHGASTLPRFGDEERRRDVDRDGGVAQQRNGGPFFENQGRHN